MMDDPQRHKVWIALSDLFLDTDHSPEALERIEMTLRASPFDLATLDQIMLDEVFPVCFSNLLTVAGIWDGFDADRLITECTKASTRPPAFASLRRYFRRRLIRTNVPEWQEMRVRLRAKDKR